MSNEIDEEVTIKRAVAIASQKSFVLGNSGNNGIGIPVTFVGPLFWACILTFNFTKLALILLPITLAIEAVVGFGMRFRDGIAGIMKNIAYSVFSTQRKCVKN
ncbi:MAG: hypothetical protein CBC55_02905 [Gammaproteobacteria bacterium TMED95]|nr:MAG: hypothetical protein CBC55_02905 [Gammaproteobacteria bacterium TMED95]